MLAESLYRSYSQVDSVHADRDNTESLPRTPEDDASERCRLTNNISANNTTGQSDSCVSNYFTMKSRFASAAILAGLALFCLFGFLGLSKYDAPDHRNNAHRFVIQSNSLSGSDDDNNEDNNVNSVNSNTAIPTYEEAVMVKTNCGKMIGIVEESAFAFKVSFCV